MRREVTNRGEYQALIRSFNEHLRRAQRRGQRWVSLPAAADGPIDERRDLQAVQRVLGECKRCGLHQGRRQIVFGAGNSSADVFFVGEAPGYDEDVQGMPFVGKAGQLLTKMITAMGMTRESVYIANIIKCRPPQNRNPLPEEIAQCEPFLREQIAAVSPRVIVAMGNVAAKTLLNTSDGITRLRGKFHDYRAVPVMPTFHPAYLLRNPAAKREAWEDLKDVLSELERVGHKPRRAS